jgi:hypothetical protein
VTGRALNASLVAMPFTRLKLKFRHQVLRKSMLIMLKAGRVLHPSTVFFASQYGKENRNLMRRQFVERLVTETLRFSFFL